MSARSGARRRRCGRRDARDDRLEDLGDAGPLLGAGEEDLLARDGERLLQLVHHPLRIGAGQVDLVDDRDDRQLLLHGEVDVGERLRLDALRGVDDEDRALAGRERSAHLVREVDVARRVDQVELVGLAVGGVVVHAHGARLDRDPLLALEVHRVEHLRRHLALVDRVRRLEQPVRERRLPVVDVRDDAEVADALRGDHPAESSGAPPGSPLRAGGSASGHRGRGVAGAGGRRVVVAGGAADGRADCRDAVHRAVVAEVRVLVQEDPSAAYTKRVRLTSCPSCGNSTRWAVPGAMMESTTVVSLAAVVARDRIGQHHAAPGWNGPELEGDGPLPPKPRMTIGLSVSLRNVMSWRPVVDHVDVASSPSG